MLEAPKTHSYNIEALNNQIKLHLLSTTTRTWLTHLEKPRPHFLKAYQKNSPPY